MNADTTLSQASTTASRKPSYQELTEHITKSDAIQRILPEACKVALEAGESLPKSTTTALFTDLAKHCDVEGCKLMISQASSSDLFLKYVITGARKHRDIYLSL